MESQTHSKPAGKTGRNTRRNDIILIALILTTALIFLAGYYLLYHEEGSYVQIEIDSTVYKTLPLDKNTTVTLTGYNNGSNILQIKDGSASIIEADCPDKLCQKQKKIKYNGETIVCLPHKIVISVISKDHSSIDGVAY